MFRDDPFSALVIRKYAAAYDDVSRPGKPRKFYERATLVGEIVRSRVIRPRMMIIKVGGFVIKVLVFETGTKID